MKSTIFLFIVLLFALLANGDDEETLCITTSDCLTLENACTFAKCIQGVCRFKAVMTKTFSPSRDEEVEFQ